MKPGRVKGYSKGATHTKTLTGPLLRAHRVSLGLGLKDVGAVLGTTDGFVGHVESGKNPLPVKYLPRLAAMLNINRTDLELAICGDLVSRKFNR